MVRGQFPLPLLAALMLATLPVQAAVFSDDPNAPHDPRHQQIRTGEGKMFAPIGQFWTSQPVQHKSGPPYVDLATAFLVSPCLLMANYHVVFGNRHVEPDESQDFSGTFAVRGKKFHAVPIRHGAYYDYEWQDWVLLKVDSDSTHPCVGEHPEIGWVQLAPLSRDDAPNQVLSVAGYPSDKRDGWLWRQDACHLYDMLPERQYRGLWTTDCATRPGASGSPIFYIQDGVLKVVALMQGHMGPVHGDEVLPKWDPSLGNLAVDMGKILSSDDKVMDLIQSDIDRFNKAKTAEQSAAVQEPADPSVAAEPASEPADKR
jgi:V8-like Glu-specific endopeptidase